MGSNITAIGLSKLGIMDPFYVFFIIFYSVLLEQSSETNQSQILCSACTNLASKADSPPLCGYTELHMVAVLKCLDLMIDRENMVQLAVLWLNAPECEEQRHF